MRTTVRLPEELAADVRQRCQRLGISVNALVCVALDAWLRQSEHSEQLPAVDDSPRPDCPAAPAPLDASQLTPKQLYELRRAQRKAARKR